MPKIKTRKGAAKRFKQTGSGKYKIEKPCKSHLLLQKSKKEKRKAIKGLIVKNQTDTIRRMVPYK